MSYLDAQRNRSLKPIVAVGLLHVVIAYGFISGLAYQVIPYVDPPMKVRQIADDPPPPRILPQPSRPTKHATPLAPTPVLQRPDLGGDIVFVPTLDPTSRSEPDPQPVAPQPVLRPSQARGAAVLGNRAMWVTTDDYPPGAMREGVEGSVGISVRIGADGHVAACEVTSTSGSALLDQQTCRMYARRARFTPALDDEGRPTIAYRVDRVRWQLPAR